MSDSWRYVLVEPISFKCVFWNFINPLCQIIVYYIVFSRIFENGIDKFHVYLIVGMMPWNFFSESLAQGAGAIVSQADMTKKIYFPREVLPISAVTSRFVNLLLTFIIIFAITIASGVTLNATALIDRKSTRLNSSHSRKSRMPSSA